MTDINQSFDSTTSFSGANFQPTSQEPLSTEGIGVQAYENSDTMQKAHESFTTQNFHGPKVTAYTQSASNPGLEAPSDEEIVDTGAQPYGKTEQKMVKQYFATSIKELLDKYPDLDQEDAESIFAAMLAQNPDMSEDDARQIFQAIMSKYPDLSQAEVESLFQGIVQSKNATIPPKMGQIAKQVMEEATDQTIQACNLPKPWSLSSKNASDWIPVPPQPYGKAEIQEIKGFYQSELEAAANELIAKGGLSESQIALLKQAVATGSPDPKVKDLFDKISSQAQLSTASQFGLSLTWNISIPTSEWVPVNVGPLSPVNVSLEKAKESVKNIDVYIQDIIDAVNVSLSSIPNDADKASLISFLTAVTQAIQGLKQSLQEMEISDAQRTEKETKGKMDAIEYRRELNEALKVKIEEAHAKQKKMAMFNKVMKYLGPTLSVVSGVLGTSVGVLITTIGIISSIMTFGATSGLIALGILCLVATVAISVGLTTLSVVYSVCDSALGWTNKAVEAFNKAIDKLMPGAEDWKKDLVKAVIIIACVAVIAVVAINLLVLVIVLGASTGSGTGLAVSAASQIITKAIQQILTQIISMVLLQAIQVLLSASNCIPKLVYDIAKACHLDEKDSKICEYVALAIQMATILIASLLVALAGNVGAVGSGIKGAAESVKGAAASAVQTVKNVARMSVDQVKDAILTAIKALGAQILASLKNIPKAIMEEIENTVKAYCGIFEDIFRAKSARGDAFLTILGLTKEATTIPGATVEIASGIFKGVLALQVANNLKAQGEIQASEQLTKELIEMLQKLLDNIQGGMSDTQDFVLNLQKQFLHMYDAASRVVTDLSSANLKG